MKQLFFFLLISTATFSQNFEKVDAKVLEYPRFSKVDDLAHKIENDFSSDVDKVRAAFFWLTKNIRYNLKEYYNPRQRKYQFRYKSEEEKVQKLQAIKDQLVNTAFRTKMGVCEEYAQSFKKICDLLNIESQVIKGNVRSDARKIGKVQNSTNHAWNTVKINGNWIILDATWAAGYEYNGKWIRKFNNYFFNMPKDKIFKTHFPEDQLWVLHFGRMSIQEFYNQPIYSQTFLSLKADLILPKTGIINLKSSEDILLKFKNLDTTALIFYTLKGTKYALKPIVKTENEISTLVIKNPKRNTDLVLYINKEDALHFKVKVR
ncbi:transglutaminase [Polaribacter reichenbachii]|uniref:Transglutaminase n=1 Tax=Polaribacter reichenbachii TaxID=996801 RepID=A0A1B8TVX8_9FLAO|nr:transglutaminase domain-containing protein [Polaribacter reichenbachii]APZ45095.1 transglutaminase [Polaribacter reichenbachii]AUC18957.1 transglutaminase [Polaribacter reichenbachii]OBY63886.1 transglutaminase [Polaribacter reichenbachii]